jgi:hypothetical protein
MGIPCNPTHSPPGKRRIIRRLVIVKVALLSQTLKKFEMNK